MPLGRKPNPKFEIPQEKKKQIQTNLSQVKLDIIPVRQPGDMFQSEQQETCPQAGGQANEALNVKATQGNQRCDVPDKTSPEYEGAGRIFLKAALWDLGIFSEESVKAGDWDYYLTYSKGIKVVLENNKSFFIDLPLPLERCIRELVEGLVNNVKPFIVHKVSDEGLFKACMESEAGFKISTISIVDGQDNILLELSNIMELNRIFILQNRVFVESNERNLKERSKVIFFSQIIDNNEVIENILNLKGFSTTNKDDNVVTLLVCDSYENITMLQGAAERLNGMYLRDEQDRLVKVKIQE